MPRIITRTSDARVIEKNVRFRYRQSLIEIRLLASSRLDVLSFAIQKCGQH